MSQRKTFIKAEREFEFEELTNNSYNCTMKKNSVKFTMKISQTDAAWKNIKFDKVICK